MILSVILMQLTEAATTSAKRTANYTYDDLDRLLTATISGTPVSGNNNTNGGNYNQTYSYSPTGNILSNSFLGTYLYDGTNNANPQAVTKAGAKTFSYDKNGNVISTLNAGITQNLTYDYRNNVTQIAIGASTTKYTYDSGYNRVKKYTPTGSDSTLSVYLGTMSWKAMERVAVLWLLPICSASTLLSQKASLFPWRQPQVVA